MAHAGQCENHLQLGYLQLNPYPMLARIDNALLDNLCAQAAASPRRRKKHNLHTSDTALVLTYYTGALVGSEGQHRQKSRRW